MVALDVLRELLNVRKRRLLLVAEAAMPTGQFQAFRKLVLDELGSNGLEQDLVRAVGKARQGTGENIHAGKEVPHG